MDERGVRWSGIENEVAGGWTMRMVVKSQLSQRDVAVLEIRGQVQGMCSMGDAWFTRVTAGRCRAEQRTSLIRSMAGSCDHYDSNKKVAENAVNWQ